MLHLKKTVFHICCAALLAAGLVFAPAAQAAAAPKPWRIALIVGGPLSTFQTTLQGFAERLAELGIIADGTVPRPEGDESLAPMWQWLAENAGGDSLRFVADAFYSPEWTPDRRAEVKKNLLERIHDKGDIDCVLAFGTWGGQDIGLESLQIPVLVIASTNAVEAGIIPSPDDSGRDNLLATIEPDRYKRQVRLFHELIGFSRLGIAYEDTPAGRRAVALREIEEAAAEAGVELLRCVNAPELKDEAMVANWLRACHENLVKQGADAVYLTYQRGLKIEHVPWVLEPLIKAGLPTFAGDIQGGSDLVKRGVLLSTANANVEGVAIFAAEALEKILKGNLPRSLSQRYESTLSLAVNLRTATRIGWNLPMEILAAVDEFYRDF
jgi:ABC-type uncharacterized transport system substrate-binding protein